MKKKIIFFGLIILIGTLLVPCMLSLPRLWNYEGSPDSWVGFWGSLLGSLLGVIGAYLVMSVQLQSDKKQHYEEKMDNTFFNLIGLFQEIREVAQNDVVSSLDEIKKAKEEIKEIKIVEDKLKKFRDDKEFFYEEINKNIEKLKDDTEPPILMVKRILEEMKKWVDQGTLIGFKSNLESLKEENDRWSLNLQLSDMNSRVTQYNKSCAPNFENGEIFNLVNDIFSEEHVKTGNYFRIFYRIIKYIMKSEIELDKKEEYLGILRALLSSEELLAIFYNAFYSKRGENLAEELIKSKTGFFADEMDLGLVNISSGIDLPFFKYEDLMFGKNDLDKIKSLTSFEGEVKVN